MPITTPQEPLDVTCTITGNEGSYTAHLNSGYTSGCRPGIKIYGPSGDWYKWIQCGRVRATFYGYFDTDYDETGLDGMTSDTTFSDTPASRCTRGLYYMMDRFDEFDTWLMFKMDATSIYVPVRKITWTWLGAAEDVAPFLVDWKLIPGSAEKSTAGGNLTDEFPVWTQKLL